MPDDVRGRVCNFRGGVINMRDMPTHIREKVADHDKTEERERVKKTKKEEEKRLALSLVPSSDPFV